MRSLSPKIRFRSQSGQTMVEFALVAPLLVTILFAIIQFGIVFKDYVTLTDATRVGARKAAVSRLDPNPVGVTTDAVRSSAPGLNDGGLVITVTPGTPWTAGSDVTVDARYPYKINLFGLVVSTGQLRSTTTERVE